MVWALTRRVGPRSEPPPGPDWQAHRLSTSDGLELGAWLYLGQAEQPLVVLLHGVGDSRALQLPFLEALASRGYGVLIPSLRGHGDSEGYAGDYLGTGRDVLAAVDFLESTYPEREVILLGRSLGAGAALFASRELGRRVGGYFLESPFANIQVAIKNRISMFLPHFLATIAYTGMKLWAYRFLVDPIHEISPLAKMDVPPGIPVTIIGGAADMHAHPDELIALRQQLGSQAELLFVEGATHNRLAQVAPDLYWGAFEKLCQAVRSSVGGDRISEGEEPAS